MKKSFYLAAISIAVLLLITGCSGKDAAMKSEITPGTYVLSETDEPVGPSVVLKEDHQFVFTYSLLSSYLPIGTYESDGDNLILKTDDGQNQYQFAVKDNTLVFDEAESSPVAFGQVKDGSVFVLQEE